jgi:hypothetical protein
MWVGLSLGGEAFAVAIAIACTEAWTEAWEESIVCFVFWGLDKDAINLDHIDRSVDEAGDAAPHVIVGKVVFTDLGHVKNVVENGGFSERLRHRVVLVSSATPAKLPGGQKPGWS